MGKEWYWGGGKSSKGGGGGGRVTDTGSSHDSTASVGCMCAMFQLFDFHQFHQLPSFDSMNPSFLPNQEDPPPISKGTEAPRNSLELEEPNPLTMSAMKEDESLNIPMGIQIRTNKDGKGSKPNGDCSSSSEISSSPGTKTPNLVARLMGLDLLPDNCCSSPTTSNAFLDTPNLQGSSSSRSSYYQHRRKPARDSKRSSCLDKNVGGTRSLPETPRVSSARRSVDAEHRFSLQFNKENVSANDEMMLSRVSSLIRRRELKIDEEVINSRSPGHYARQIVKQVKESVSRKVGLDITNTVKNRDLDQTANYPNDVANQFKSKKISKILTKRVDVSSSQSQSCSPRIKFLESKNKPTTQTQNVVPQLATTKDHSICQNVVPQLATTKDHSICHKSSPRLQFSVLNSHVNIVQIPQNSKPSTVSAEQDKKCHQQKQNRPNSSKKCSNKMAAEERIGPFVPSRLKKPPQTSEIIRINKQEEPTGKKCKKNPLSNDHIVPTIPLLPVKKDPTPPATKIPQKQVVGASNSAQESKRCTQLSSCTCQSYYKQQFDTTHLLYNRKNDRSNGCATTTAAAAAASSTTARGCGESAEAEYQEYITRILKRTGIDKDTPVSNPWFSPSNPLDPSIFYYLELFYYPNGQLRQRCNRKLLFQLVDEILAQVLREDGNFTMNGSHLVEILCKKVGSFPSADCRVLEDIDGLIDGDLRNLIKVEDEEGFEEELEEGIVSKMEEEVLDGLIHETAAVFHETARRF